KPAPDHQSLPGVEAIERALLDAASDRGEPGKIGGAHAAHQHARAVEGRCRERLSLNDGRDKPYAFDPGDAGRDHLPIDERALQRLDQQMAIEAEDLVEQLLAEAV